MNPAFEATVTFVPPLAGGDAAPSRWPAWLQDVLRPLRGIPEEALDRSTGLYNRRGLFAAAGEALDAREDGEPVSVIVLEFTDLREVRHIYGPAIARRVVARIVRRLRQLAGLRGFVGRTGPTQFTVVLPATGEDRAVKQAARVLGKPARVEFDAGDDEIVLVPQLLVDTTDPAAGDIQSLYRGMSRELARIHKEEQRRLHFLASERERHSRPMSLPAH